MKINIEDQTSEKTAGFRLNPNLIPILACVGYASASISMTLSNKAMFTYFRFDFPITMLIWQSIFTIALMWILEKFNVISYRELKSEVASVWLPVNILFIVMLVSGAFAIKHLSVPMITIFKNLSTVITTYGDAYVTKSTVPTGVAFSCGLIVLSSVVAASADLSFDFIGYSIMAFNCVITSAYLIYMKHVSSRNPNTKNYLDSWTMTYYNSALSLPFLIPLSFFVQRVPRLFSRDEREKMAFCRLHDLDGSRWTFDERLLSMGYEKDESIHVRNCRLIKQNPLGDPRGLLLSRHSD